MPVIGFLYFGWPDPNIIATFRKGLNETGYFEGHNLAIEFRSAQNDTARLQELAADLVRRQVAAPHRAAQRHSRQRQRPRRSRLFSTPPVTLSKWASWLASIGRTAMPPASPTCTWRL